jgi:cytosine/adenosine deaminase-related metal-dependent hydrolase
MRRSRSEPPTPVGSALVSDRVVVRGGLVLSHAGNDRGRWELTRVDLVIEDGRIVERAPDITGGGDRIVNAEGLLVMPALANTHTHSFEYGLKGFKSGRNIDHGHPEWFWTIYKSYPEELALLSADAHYAENLAAGVSVVGDVLRSGLIRRSSKRGFARWAF